MNSKLQSGIALWALVGSCFFGFWSQTKSINVHVYSQGANVGGTQNLDEYNKLIRFFESQKNLNNEYSEYYQICKDLSTLCCNDRSVLIDPNFVISTQSTTQAKTANLLTRQSSPFYLHAGDIESLGSRPNTFEIDQTLGGPFDSILGYSNNSYVAPVVERYRGVIKPEDTLYIYSKKLHAEHYRLVGQLNPSQVGLCMLTQMASNNHKALLQQRQRTSQSVIILTKGSPTEGGNPIFIKVASTGRPVNDYQYVGTTKELALNSECFFNATLTENSAAIDKMILAKSLGQSAPIPPSLTIDVLAKKPDINQYGRLLYSPICIDSNWYLTTEDLQTGPLRTIGNVNADKTVQLGNKFLLVHTNTKSNKEIMTRDREYYSDFNALIDHHILKGSLE